MRRFMLSLLVAVLVLAGGVHSVFAQSDDAMPPAAQTALPGAEPAYVLGIGDRVHLTVYGEADLSGDYDVGSTGIVALPLVGNVQAAGYSIHQFEEAVTSKLSQGYIKNPRVNAQVTNYRPFFILGEVSKPGSYPYVNGMTVLNAVALAGGFTYRAKEDGAVIVRANDPQKAEQPAPQDTRVKPGDVIRVPERFF